jgi:2-pyrone-4,6-dicarboxylate lactonase
MDRDGIKGARFNFIKRLVDSTPKDVMVRIANRIAKLGWHVVIYFEHADLDEMGPFLKSLPTTLVFDHMACPNVKEGVNGKHFQNWLKALDENKNWITKVTCPERFTLVGPPYDDVVPFARTIVERFPDRVIWGTDWPHPNMPKEAPDDGVITDMIPKIAPTAELQKKLLVDNPTKLYWG